MSEIVRFGLVGTGAIAQSYVVAFQNVLRAQLVAVCDSNPLAAKAFAEQTSTRCYFDLETMVAGSGFDAVIVCTPPSTHEAISTFFLERGIHVLCEKPITIDSLSLSRMFAAANRSAAKLTMATKFRYVADVIRAKQMVERGLLGDVVLFENRFMSAVDMSARWNSQRAISGGGVFIDNGTHSVDIMRYLLGPIQSIKVVEGKRIKGLSVDETAHALVRGSNGILGRIDLSWSVPTDKSTYINIHGSHGTIDLGWKESSYSLHATADRQAFGTGYDKVMAFSSQLNNFTDSLLGRAESLITEEDIVASVEVIEAGYRSLASGEWESVGASALLPKKRTSDSALSEALQFTERKAA